MPNNLKRAIDTDLGCLRTTSLERARILQNALEGKKVKRKISAALVFVLVMVLIAGMALAAMSLRDTARQIVETEQTDGFYKSWPVKKKISLVSELAGLGYIEETAEVKKLIANALPEEEADLAARAIRETYGLDEDTLALYKLVSIFFDITNPEKPLWKFLFQPETWTDFEGGLDNPQYDLRYRVEIDARTGDIAMLEEFEFQLLGQDLEYDLKWY